MFGNSSISMREVIITSFLSCFDEKKQFEGCYRFKFNNLGLALGMALILQQCGKRVKIKTRKVLEANSCVCRSYRGKTNRGAFLRPAHPE